MRLEREDFSRAREAGSGLQGVLPRNDVTYPRATAVLDGRRGLQAGTEHLDMVSRVVSRRFLAGLWTVMPFPLVLPWPWPGKDGEIRVLKWSSGFFMGSFCRCDQCTSTMTPLTSLTSSSILFLLRNYSRASGDR